MDYTAQGHTVGLAARMEQMADPGKALLTGHAAKLVSGYFQLRDLGATRLPLAARGAQSPRSCRRRADDRGSGVDQARRVRRRPCIPLGASG
jgi:class 3 adenylate cyclase